MLDDEQLLVGRKTAQSGLLDVAIDLLRIAVRGHDVDGGSLIGRTPQRGQGAAQVQAGVVGALESDVAAFGAVEGLDQPAAELVTVVALPTLIGMIAAVVGLGIGVIAGWAGGAAAADDLVAGIVVPWSVGSFRRAS